MEPLVASEHAWRQSHYGAVYCVLTDFVDSPERNFAPGADGIFGHARCWLQGRGEAEALARLERISLTVFRLQLALRSRAEADYDACALELEKLAWDWLLHAPMIPEPAGAAPVALAA